MHAIALVDTLKRILKGRGITYAAVAAGLGLSEASVKRMFSRRDFTLQRLEDVCRIAGVDFGELAHEAALPGAGLSAEQHHAAALALRHRHQRPERLELGRPPDEGERRREAQRTWKLVHRGKAGTNSQT